MNRRNTVSIAFHLTRFWLGLFLLAQAVFPLQAESVFVVGPGYPRDTLSRDDLRSILRGEKSYWDDGKAVALAIVESDSSVAAIEAEAGLPFGQLKNIWTRLAFTGRGFDVRTFATVDQLILFLQNRHGVLGCLPQEDLSKDLRVIRIE